MAFGEKVVLKRHMAYVHSDKTFVCELCNKPFGLIAALNNHKKLRHRVDRKNLQCDSCDKSFPSTAYLKKHIHRNHNPQLN